MRLFWFSAERIGESVKFVLPEVGIKVYFDGYSVNIKARYVLLIS